MAFKIGKDVVEKTLVTYVPHGINPETFKPLDNTPEGRELILKKKSELSKNKEYDFIVLYNNRNIRRKQTSDIILAYRTFCDSLPKDKSSKCLFLLHTQPVDEAEEPCVCDETCTCTEQECADPACTCEKPEEPKVEPKEFHHEFQDEYHFGPGNGDAVIDTLPQEPVKVPEKQERKRKTFAQMTACEMNIYHKTGIIPFC